MYIRSVPATFFPFNPELSYKVIAAMQIRVIFLFALFISGFFCNTAQELSRLKTRVEKHYLITEEGKPFLWIGGTSWGMPEWLTRDQIDLYLDDRKAKGINVVQVCLFWGKRHDDPVMFYLNPPNAYGHRAFQYTAGIPDPERPDVKKGGSPVSPNDYWDHVDYIVQAVTERNMYLAALPVWGRRYVNASHEGFSHQIFNEGNSYAYGKFLGDRYKANGNIIWVMGGDVNAVDNGDYRNAYRKMAEGILTGVTGKKVAWNKMDPSWDAVVMTYHPNGYPYQNSSQWFHEDAWMDFNMIQTFIYKDDLYEAVLHDYKLAAPVRPTVLGEPQYEGYTGDNISKGIDMRRQMYQTFFAGGAGFTYGAFRDSLNNGPLFSPYRGWQRMLNMEGACDLAHLRNFLVEHEWYDWIPDNAIVKSRVSKNPVVTVLSRDGKKILAYFSANQPSQLMLPHSFNEDAINIWWFNPADGKATKSAKITSTTFVIQPPSEWADAVLIIQKE